MREIATEVLVVGSGAGGAVTAALLAEAGRDVTVVEEGPRIEADRHQAFSLDELAAKYRNGGPNAMLGSPPISFVEGCCVGGGTEVNSGLYHLAPDAVLQDWAARWGVADCDRSTLNRYAGPIATSLSVGPLPGPPSGLSSVLARGAEALGWAVVEVPRPFVYPTQEQGLGFRGVKQTMSRTFIPRAVAAGAQIQALCRARRILWSGRRASGVLCTVQEGAESTRLHIHADQVVLSAGAIGTSALLQRSGIRMRNAHRLRVHPMVKMAAIFDDPLDGHDDVPVHQVRMPGAEVTLGGSISSPGYVALALAEDWVRNEAEMRDWDRIGVYYAGIRTDGQGRVVSARGIREPFVHYRLEAADLSRLAGGLVGLGRLLFAAGARRVFPAIAGCSPISSPEELARLWDSVRRDSISLTTLHLFATVPMGERRDRTAADSFGRIWGFDNLRVHDASIIPDAPGVNPQGTIMALAARNTAQMLGSF